MSNGTVNLVKLAAAEMIDWLLSAGRGVVNLALSDIPCVELSSSSLLILFVVVSPGGVLVVGRAGFKAAVDPAG
jgi:hypothetical protein